MSFHIKAHAFMLTYNWPDDKTYDFEEFVNVFREEKMDPRDVASFVHEKETRDHFHVYLHSTRQIDCDNSVYNMWEMENPNVKPNTMSGSGYKVAVQRGHFYVSCEHKKSYIVGISDYPPNVAYVVRQKWIMDLWAKDKIADPISAMAFYNCLTPAAQAQVTMSLNRKRLDNKKAAKVARREAILASFSAFPKIDCVEEWKLHYNTVLARYNFLVLWGPSRTGKTEYARSLFKNPFIHEDSVCWNGYDEDEHDVIIFDDVKSVYKYISDNRKLFQASSDVMTQTSATNVYALSVDVTAKPIIVTSNEPPGSEWIMANAVIHNVKGPLWAHPLEGTEGR